MEDISNDKWDFQEAIRQNDKSLKQHRGGLGNRAYPSHPEINRSNYNERLLNKGKFNNSRLANDTTKRRDQQPNTLNIIDSTTITDSCTQTSKTILQLAKLEAEQLSPDSLTTSPREANRIPNKNEVGTDESMTLQYNLEGSPNEQPRPSIAYVRKNSLNEYLFNYKPPVEYLEKAPAQGIEDVKVYPKKSLTETFLKKKRNKAENTCQCRSRFLQQRSPLRNLPRGVSTFPTKKANDYFKSRSYIEPQSTRYGIDQDEEYSNKLQLPVSRFTIKNVREQLTVDRTQSMQHHWNTNEPEETDCKFEDVYESFDNDEEIDSDNQMPYGTNKNTSRKQSSSFMAPTIASERKNQQYKVQNVKNLISSARRGQSLSPHRHSRPPSNIRNKINKEKIPFTDASRTRLEMKEKGRETRKQRNSVVGNSALYMSPLMTRPKFDEDLLRLDLQSLDVKSSEETIGESFHQSCSTSISSNDNIVAITMTRIRSPDWNTAVRGLAEMTELCRIMDPELLFPHMTTVNQKLIELLRSPRSHVCRTACQASGHFFESMKDTRKPEFDDIVEILLHKTADANKFIRKDANLSLDCMVTHIPLIHTVRTLCLKGPTHKNPLVRTATTRLLVCAVVIAGPDIVLNGIGLEPTRKRIIHHMVKALEDKDQDARKYAERLYKVLYKEPAFETVLKKYLDKEEITNMKHTLKTRREKK